MKNVHRSYRFVRRNSPCLATGVVVVLYVYYQEEIVIHILEGKLNVSNLYSAIFGWAAIQTGFLFGTYAHVSTKKDGFVAAIAGTEAFNYFRNYIRSAFARTLLVSICSVPMLVVVPTPERSWDVESIVLCLWMAFSVYTFAGFARVLRVFRTIEGVSGPRT